MGSTRRQDSSFTGRFLVSVLFSLIAALFIGYLFIIPRLEYSIIDLQKKSSQKESDIVAAEIQLFVEDRVAVLKDVAAYPIVKNGVMGAGISPEDLKDFLDPITVMGELTPLYVLNILAEPVYRRDRNFFQTYYEDEAWFQRVLLSESEYEVVLIKRNDLNYMQIAVPIRLDGYVEGVLVGVIPLDFRRVFSYVFSEGDRNLIILQNNVSFSAQQSGSDSPMLTLAHDLPDINLQMAYQIGIDELRDQRTSFVWAIMISILVTVAVTFMVLIIAGLLTLVTPYVEMQQLTEERDQALKEAEESSRAKSQFLANTSHEIRTPINGVVGMLTLLRRDANVNEKHKYYIDLAKSSAESLLNLVNDILDYSKIEAGKLDVEDIEYDVQELFESVVSSFAFRAKENGVELYLDTTNIRWKKIKGDPTRIRQCINNLLSNAIKFSSGGAVFISAEQIDKGDGIDLVCSVRDTGIGISKTNLEKLFQAFSQVDASTTREFGGTGLGLVIVKQLCQLMHGDIDVESQEGDGSTFTFWLPIYVDQSSGTDVTGSLLVDTVVYTINKTDSERNHLGTMLDRFGAKTFSYSHWQDLQEALESSPQLKSKSRLVVVAELASLGVKAKSLHRYFKNPNNGLEHARLVAIAPATIRGDRYHHLLGMFDDYVNKPVMMSTLIAGLLPDFKQHYEGSERSLLDRYKQVSNHLLSNDKKKILVVDDNVVNQEVAIGLIEDLGVEVDVADNGVEAIAAVRRAHDGADYDLVLMDCQMPIMDGYQATKEIRAGKAGEDKQNIPIVAMTANVMKGDRQRCIDAGMDDYLSKPIEEDKLIRVIVNCLGLKEAVHTRLEVSADRLDEISEDSAQSFQVDDSHTVHEQEILVWDKDALMNRLRGKEDRCLKLVSMFLASADQRMTDIHSAVNEADPAKLKYAAHTLKGSVANLGGEVLRLTLQGIESDHDNIDYAKSQLDRLNHQYQEFIVLLKDYVSNSEHAV